MAKFEKVKKVKKDLLDKLNSATSRKESNEIQSNSLYLLPLTSKYFSNKSGLNICNNLFNIASKSASIGFIVHSRNSSF